MTDLLPRARHDVECEILQNRLTVIDKDYLKLQNFVGELFRSHNDNPHIFYMAAAHLTALSHLDRRNAAGDIILPNPDEAAKAFAAYTQLMYMLSLEKDAPRYVTDERIRKRLGGTNEELAFHATLAFATAHGADFVARPTPANMDFTGFREASDVQVFFDGAQEADLEIQVKYQPDGYIYHPRIAILSLTTALGDLGKAVELRGVLKDIGQQTDGTSDAIMLPDREYDIIMNGAAGIMQATYDWGSNETMQAATA